MNDSDLDELLDIWTAPAPPPLLRDRLRKEWRTKNARPHRKRWLAITLLAAAVLSALIGSAVSQTASAVPSPWIADSEFIRYAADGSSSVEMTATSYPVDGSEILWSRADPGNPMATVFFRAADTALPPLGRALYRATSGRLIQKPDTGRVFGFVTGCGEAPLTGCLTMAHYSFLRKPDTCIDGSVAGAQTILNHPTIGVLVPMGDSMRSTFWVAPDLGCFALRIDIEKRQTDGAFHLVEEKRVVGISATTR